MSWWKPSERREIVDWPEGRDWRCQGWLVDGVLTEGCGFSKPEDAPGDGHCPDCGERLSRTVSQL